MATLAAVGAHLRCCQPEPELAPLAAATAAASPTVEIREASVPMTDGATLAADLYPPVPAPLSPLPVLLEYTPYRKTESRGSRYDLYSYFVERGFVVARVDIRGTGNSLGKMIPHEYSDVELDDGVSLIAWLAAQEWSNGNVGMFGISWGGFNSIQLAATRQPPALKVRVFSLFSL